MSGFEHAAAHFQDLLCVFKASISTIWINVPIQALHCMPQPVGARTHKACSQAGVTPISLGPRILPTYTSIAAEAHAQTIYSRSSKYASYVLAAIFTLSRTGIDATNHLSPLQIFSSARRDDSNSRGFFSVGNTSRHSARVFS